MKKSSITFLLFAIISFSLFTTPANAVAPAAPENIAPKCVITSSPLANPVWTAAKAADNSDGPADGWLGEWKLSTGNLPWISFSLPSRSMVSGVDVMQASLSQASKNRFSRPKKITAEFTDGVNTQQLVFNLKDAEDDFQKLKFAPIPADTIVITINEVYPGERVPDSAGFQEIRVYGYNAPGQRDQGDYTGTAGSYPSGSSSQPRSIVPDGAAPSKSANYRPSTISEPVPGEGWKTEQEISESETPPAGTLSEDEKEILSLLRELINKLEKKFLED